MEPVPHFPARVVLDKRNAHTFFTKVRHACAFGFAAIANESLPPIAWASVTCSDADGRRFTAALRVSHEKKRNSEKRRKGPFAFVAQRLQSCVWSLLPFGFRCRLQATSLFSGLTSTQR